MRMHYGFAGAVLALGLVAGAARATIAQQPAPPGAGAAGPGRGGFVAYPQRPPGDPAAIARGKVLYGINCTFCHGADVRGGDGGGPNLLRSAVVLDDQRGERLAPVIRSGRGSMPPIALTDEQIADLAAFLHTFEVSGTSRAIRVPIDIVVGDAKKGEAYVAAKCASCHNVDRLRAFAAKFEDPKMLQQMWLMPGFAGRGAAPPVEVSPATVTVTLRDGQKITGTLHRVDDFVVSLTDGDGRHRTFRSGPGISVTVHDPLAPHKDLLRTYTDADIHNVTAYLISLRRAS
jgi:mono/diheme cytochrome c family protein